MSIECLLFGTIPGPCFDHAGTMYGLALLPDQLELCNFKDWIKMVNKLSSAGIGSIKLRFYLAQLSWNLRKKLSPAGISSEKLSSKDMSLIQFFSAKLKILHVPNSCLLFFDKDKLLILAVYCYLYMVHPYQLSPDWRFERICRQRFFGWAGVVEFS